MKEVASLKSSIGEAQVHDMASKIAIAEQMLRVLKEKKDKLGNTVRKL